MLTVILPTANRPRMLRTALESIESQSAKEKIGCVIVSENGGAKESAAVCAEFPNLPIQYTFRDPATDAKTHGSVLFTEAAALSDPYVAVLHDDDWWGTEHVANGLKHLQASGDAVAYWSTCFVVDGESSWYLRCWNIASWMAAGFPPLSKVAKLDRKQAALACLGSAPAHYSTLVAEKHALAGAYLQVSKTGNLLDNDRLLFLELAKRGSILMNFVPEVFVRQHQVQEQFTFSSQTYKKHTGATTRVILQFCKEEGIDVVGELERRFDECPNPEYRPSLMTEITPGVMKELRRHDPVSAGRLLKKHYNAKWFARELCPPLFWEMARQVKSNVHRTNLR